MGNKIAVVAILLWLMTVASAAFVFIHGNTATAPDGRTSVIVQPGERAFVLSEMRSLLAAVQQITAGLATGDNAKVAQAARSVGSAAMHGATPTLMAKLPIEFKKAAFALHGGFDDLASAADRNENPSALAAQLGQQLERCVACHKDFRFDEAK